MSNLLYFYGMCGLLKDFLLYRYFSKVLVVFYYLFFLLHVCCLFVVIRLNKEAALIVSGGSGVYRSSRIRYSSSMQKSKFLSPPVVSLQMLVSFIFLLPSLAYCYADLNFFLELLYWCFSHLFSC